MSLKLAAVCCLALLCFVAAASASSTVRPGSNEDLKEARLRNLAEAIAELTAEAQAETHQSAAEQPIAHNTFVQLAATRTEPAQPESKPAKSAAKAEDHHESEPAERKTPRFQGTNRNDLVALWRFDDASNPGKGFGGAGRNLKVFGKGVSVVTGVEAKRGKGSLRFEGGQDSYLARDASASGIAGMPKEDDSFTLAAWYKVTAHDAGSYGVLAFGGSGSGTSNRLLAAQSGRAIASFNDGSKLKSNNSADVGEAKWHHAAVTYDRSSRVQRVYVDGVLSGRRTLKESPAVSSPGTFLLGAVSRSARGKPFVGLLDDVAVFRVALNEEEVGLIQAGRFEPYLDLFALRNCRTRIGRRNHGAGFVAGFEDEEVAVNNNTLAYGFRADNAFQCSVRCAQTTNCRQSVFMASRRSSGAKGGRCYLQSRKYSTFESDPRSTSTVCDKASETLQKNSFTLKLSADFDAQAARAIRRKARQSRAKQHKSDAARQAERNAEAKRTADARATRSGEAKRAGKQAAKHDEHDDHAKDKGKSKATDEERERAERRKAEKRERKRRSAERKARRAARAAARREVEAKLRSRFADKITALQDRIKAKESALRASKSQATHRALMETQRTSRIIAKLNARVKALQKKVQSKEEETKALALAASIKAAADQKSSEILAAAKQRAIATRKEARMAHRRRMRERLEGRRTARKPARKVKLTKQQKAARAAAKAMAKADAKRAAEAQRLARKAERKAAKAAKAKAAEQRRKRKAALARAAGKKLAPKSKPVRSNPAQNGGMKF